MADADGFCVVKGKKACKFRPHSNQPNTSKLTVKEDGSFNLQDFRRRLDSCIQEISKTQFFSTNIEKIISSVLLISQNTTSSNSWERAKVQEMSHHGLIPVDAKIHTTDSSSLTCTTSSNLHHQHHPVPEAIQTNSPDLDDVTTSVELLSLSDHQEDIQILSYGIGSFLSCVTARYQLAFLLAIRKIFGERCKECCVYDPVFSNQEKLVLESYNCQVISENEEGKRECTKPTLAFLPHCGKALYNNLLWRNLATNNSQGLSLLVLIGNSFSNILERTPKRVLSKTGNYLLQLSPHMTEVQLDNTFTHKDIFNDLSIHYILGPQLAAALRCVGPHYEEPVYEGDDAEFIGK
ncbi:unnamed protein product [Candidula unifasciata]|uniref:SRR1-like domain-containing protein n=1 Tax=Candidula unifasciata TaxID=100452 RepID=A0A8S3Z3G4_9EUPU|nr:unnamed protein product [Candidula unifasciata]